MGGDFPQTSTVPIRKLSLVVVGRPRSLVYEVLGCRPAVRLVLLWQMLKYRPVTMAFPEEPLESKMVSLVMYVQLVSQCKY